MASSFAESFRSQSRQEFSYETLKDSKETPTNIYRAKANLLEDRARFLIAQPALEACRIELFCIESLLQETVKDLHVRIPLDFISCQKIENELGLIWKAFIEFQTYTQISFDTRSDLIQRGLTTGLTPESDFADVHNRDTFLQKFNTSAYQSIHQKDLDQLYASIIPVLENSDLLLAYEKTLTVGYDDATFLGNLPTGVSALKAVD